MEKLPEGSETLPHSSQVGSGISGKVGGATRAAELTPEQHKTLEVVSPSESTVTSFLADTHRLDYN